LAAGRRRRGQPAQAQRAPALRIHDPRAQDPPEQRRPFLRRALAVAEHPQHRPLDRVQRLLAVAQAQLREAERARTDRFEETLEGGRGGGLGGISRRARGGRLGAHVQQHTTRERSTGPAVDTGMITGTTTRGEAGWTTPWRWASWPCTCSCSRPSPAT